MRNIVSYYAETNPDGSIRLSRCLKGVVDDVVVSEWDKAIEWLIRPPVDNTVFNVVFSLLDFTRALFSLLPDEVKGDIEKEDRINYQNCKVFYANGRYLGLTATLPVNESANRYKKEEINIQALKWWVSEEEDEPADVKETWELGNKIVKALETMGFTPTKLTSPVAVFVDCYLGNASKYPTVFSFPEEYFGAMEYATEMMRHEWRSAYQIGYFKETYLYDLNNAYPAAIAQLPSTDDCRIEHCTEYPDWAQWGIMYGEVEVWEDISPLVKDMGDSVRINPKGKWSDCFTTGEIRWIEKWGAGRFKLADGYFFRFGKDRPYKQAIMWLLRWRNNPDKFVSTIAKKMGQGISGKLDEDRQDGKKGDFYNPILAGMTRSYSRLKVGDFIYANGLPDDLVAVTVDSVLATKKVELREDEKEWREEGISSALVLSKGNVWRQGKKPQGISYEQLLEALHDNPDSAYYEFKTRSGSIRSVDLLLGEVDSDRVFDNYPECGGDVLNNVCKSEALIL